MRMTTSSALPALGRAIYRQYQLMMSSVLVLRKGPVLQIKGPLHLFIPVHFIASTILSFFSHETLGPSLKRLHYIQIQIHAAWASLALYCRRNYRPDIRIQHKDVWRLG